MPVDAKYKTSATAHGGGRDGRAVLGDKSMDLQLTVPKELGGPGGAGANPEQLFALGYAACYLGAMRVGSQQTGIKVPQGTTVQADIGIGPRSEGGFGITTDLDVYLPGLSKEDAEKLTEVTHGICPYSNAIRGNVALNTKVRT